MADLHYYAGDALIRLERPAEAEYHLMQELRAFPHNVRARAALAALTTSRAPGRSGRSPDDDDSRLADAGGLCPGRAVVDVVRQPLACGRDSSRCGAGVGGKANELARCAVGSTSAAGRTS